MGEIDKELKLRKESFVFQNFFIELGKKFAFFRIYIKDLSVVATVSNILAARNIAIKYGTLSTIEQQTSYTKWTLFFTIDDPKEIEELRTEISKTEGVLPITTFDKDIVFLAEGYGFSIEYPIVGYTNLSEGAHRIILMGGFWDRIIDRLDKLMGARVTTNLMFQIGREQGVRLAQLPNRLKPDNPRDPATVENLLQGYGYCQMTYSSGEDGVNEITVADSFFRRRNRTCSFLLGFFEAFFSQLYGREHKFDESICWGNNHSHCSFLRHY